MGAALKGRRMEHFRRHEPDNEEILRALRESQSTAYWRSLEPHALMAEFEEQLKAALLEGGFRRVDSSQLTRNIGEDPFFTNSVLGPSFPAKSVPFTKAGDPGFFAVHRASTTGGATLQFGFLTSLLGTPYFRQPDGSPTYIPVQDSHRSWPHCNEDGRSAPATASLFWKR